MPTERRKDPRLGLAIPLRVQWFLADGTTCGELTTTVDISTSGARFPLSHEVELGEVLLLSLALPKRLRQYDINDASYCVYALVRGVRRRSDQPRVGVMFFGKLPPRGFQERPAARYLLPSDSIVNAPALDTLVGLPPEAGPSGGDLPDDSRAGCTPPALTAPSALPKGRAGPSARAPQFQPLPEVPQDRRGARRVDIFVNFTIQLVDEWGAVLQEELTVTDNVAKGGARVMTTLGFQLGDIVLLQEAGGGFATRAEVRGMTQARPTVDRLHLRFLDRQAPERLLRQ